MSLADYHSKFPNGHKAKKGRNKFNASKVTLDGMTFDSKKELKRYIELKAMQQRGEIQDLQHHTKFELAPRTKIEGERELSPHYVTLLILRISPLWVFTLWKM